MRESVLEVRDLGKMFRLGGPGAYSTLRDAIARAAKSPFRRFHSSSRGQSPHPIPRREDRYIWALRHVSFEVQKGEAVGIIGPNGAGKSTLLRVLSRITEPTEGWAKIRGRIGSLLDVGTGFHPELTGRENIYVSGAILGMKRIEINQKFEDIVAFSELERFLDTPVKHYSSGMYVRLAFAVAAHLEPEILLVDEVLAVGDLAFQKKCLGKMEDVTEEGRTVLFVSHNMAAIQALTHRAICLKAGRVLSDGETEETIQRYLEVVDSATPAGSGDLSLRTEAKFLQSIEILQGGKPVSVIRMGTPIAFKVTLHASRPINRPSVGVAIDSEQGVRIVGFTTLYDVPELPSFKGEWTAYCDAGVLPLNQGTYYVKASLTDGPEDLDEVERACKFEVVPDDVFKTGNIPTRRQGFFFWHGKWSLEGPSGPIPLLRGSR